jgi:hypothetical protein
MYGVLQLLQQGLPNPFIEFLLAITGKCVKTSQRLGGRLINDVGCHGG